MNSSSQPHNHRTKSERGIKKVNYLCSRLELLNHIEVSPKKREDIHNKITQKLHYLAVQNGDFLFVRVVLQPKQKQQKSQKRQHDHETWHILEIQINQQTRPINVPYHIRHKYILDALYISVQTILIKIKSKL